MLTLTERFIFIFIILVAFVAFAYPVSFRLRIIRSGLPEKRFGNFGKRIGGALSKVFLQRCTLKNERVFTGLVHVFIFYGALSFDTMTVNHTMEGFIDNFFLFGRTNFGLFFSLIVDIFAIGVLAGVIFFLIRRYIIRPKAYATSSLDSGIIYFLLTASTLSYLYFEGFAIASHPETERLAFLGAFIANALGNMGLAQEILSLHLKISWWLHILIVYGFIVYVPHSKYFHMFTGPVNLFFHSQKPRGELSSLDLAVETAEVFGVEKASDMTWKDFLDAFSCMECGRCQDACPAFASDKPLSPKMIILNLKNHLLREGRKFIGKKRDDIQPLMGDIYTEGEIWTCTTCGACMHVCPVEIEHIPKIVGVRQSQVLMESRFPQELNTFFRNIETNSNPWGLGFAHRSDWAEGLDVKLCSEHPEAEYLLWVGCAGAYDEAGQKIIKALVTILKNAGLDFAILGTEEKCCGDSVRRLGNEYLFQIMAEENMKLFKTYNIKKIIVICPHGYNTFKHEYPGLLRSLSSFTPKEKDVLRRIEIVHHVQLLDQLIKKRKLSLEAKSDLVLTYHDSCYLGRHNDIIDEPRQVLSQISSNRIVELENNKEHSFCCGAGGGLMWTEESIGVRMNHLRTDEVIRSKAQVVATSCPFCLTMLQDGLKDKEIDNVQAMDIIQLAAQILKE